MFSSGSKREIGKSSGATPPAQKVKPNTSSEVLPNPPTWPGTRTETTQQFNTPPVQGGSESSEVRAGVETGAGTGSRPSEIPMEPTNADIMRLLLEERENRKTDNGKILTSIDTLREKTDDLQKAVELEKITREKEIGELKSKITDFEKRDQNLVVEMVQKQFAMQSKNMFGNENDQMREKQVIVSGFEECEEETIIQELQQTLKSRQLFHKVDSIFTFVDPSKIAVVEFETVAAKRGFFKKLQSSKLDLGNGNVLYFNNNDTWEMRVTNKTLGFVKYQLATLKGIPHEQFRIDRRKLTVKHKDKLKAWYNDAGEIQYAEDMEDVKAGVETLIEAWLAKRSQNQE